ncbi:MAG: Gfo/Idh/MocA family oxidoreductase [Bacteroidia bacterium]
MHDHLNKKVLLVGAGQMAIDYCKVLTALNCNITTVGRNENSAAVFEGKTGINVIVGGLENFLKENTIHFDAVIVAVGMEQLMPSTVYLLNNNFKNILIEKPAGLYNTEIKQLAKLAIQKQAKIVVAYNRRFYASVLKAKEIIKADGGVTSFNFEFTEWAHIIEPLKKAPGIKENWILANSTHVIDLAFYLGGIPQEMKSYAGGNLSWHDKAIFAGAGKTKGDVLFSYQANWDAPGRWGVEVLTAKSRLILRPLEDLFIQLKGEVTINKVEFDKSEDIAFKPGLMLQTNSFLMGNVASFKTIEKQAEMLDIYDQIAKGN